MKYIFLCLRCRKYECLQIEQKKISAALWAGLVKDGIAFIMAVVFMAYEFKQLRRMSHEEQSHNNQPAVRQRRTEIGEKLSAKLDVPLHDKSIIERIVKEKGYCTEVIEQFDEKKSQSLLFSLAMNSYDNGTQTMITDLCRLPFSKRRQML